MSILAYAVVLTLCHGPSQNDSCSDYHIETYTSEAEAKAELMYESELMGIAWGSDDDRLLEQFLKHHNVKEDQNTMVSYDFTVQPLLENETP